jgi:[ribosomal protein S5]-alanine N-acetyltransferase
MELNTPLRTARLILRTLKAADATARYLGWMRDPEVNRYLESRRTEHTLESLQHYIETCNAGPDLLLGICLADGSHIGNIKLGPIDAYHAHAPIGLLIGERASWGKGYATEAIDGLTAHAFSTMGLEKLYAGAYAANAGSIRAFLKAGWVEEGRSTSLWRSGDSREDNVQLGITRSDWLARRG